MAAVTHNHNAVPSETPITIKISINDTLKKVKLPLRDLGANVLPDKVCYSGVHRRPQVSILNER
jgi:next to BRCA1 gene 1 protein